MAENETTTSPAPAQTQKQRWLKYGSNVAIATVVVIALGILITYIAQRHNARLDTTQTGAYSLKPQTINIIRDLKSPVKLVSLYEETINTTTADGTVSRREESDYAQVVEDLLMEYKREGRNIDVEIIDPVANPTKVDALIEEVTRKYGGEVQRYKEFLDAYPATYEQLKTIAAEEAQKVAALPLREIATRDLAQTVMLTIATVQDLPEQLEQNKQRIDRRLKPPLPDFKGATESVDANMDTVSQIANQIVEDFTRFQDDEQVPAAIRDYMAQSLQRYQELKRLADETMTKIDELGELKLDELRTQLRAKNSILVLGENDMRTLGVDQVWVEPDRRSFGADDEEIKPRFAGEQQITSAILSLTNEKKPKVVFIRPGGAPLTDAGFPPFAPAGPLSEIAQRLRNYNFEVLEKDASGTYAMQAQMQGRPVEPEPTDEEIADAIWIVLSVPEPQQNPMMPMPPASISPMVVEHLQRGGAALLLFLPNANDLSEALDPFGIDVMTDVIAVHERVKESSGAQGDMIEEAKRVPFIFVMNQFGDHVITRPLQSLDALLLGMVPVAVTPAEGVTATPLLPIPQTPPSWGERSIETVMREGIATFDAPAEGAPGDIPAPLHAAAAAERAADGARVVAIGSVQFATNDLLTLPDQALLERNRYVARFPANAELILNSVFWLAKMEPMIAISPAAMEVSRIEPITEGTLTFWRLGVVMIGLPALVVAAGTAMYLARRD